MSIHTSAGTALSPDVCADVIRELGSALDLALDRARFVRSGLRDLDVPADIRADTAEVWISALVDGLTQTAASVATLPEVWPLVSAYLTDPVGRRPDPPPSTAPYRPTHKGAGRPMTQEEIERAWSQIPPVVDVDAAIERKHRAEADRSR